MPGDPVVICVLNNKPYILKLRKAVSLIVQCKLGQLFSLYTGAANLHPVPVTSGISWSRSILWIKSYCKRQHGLTRYHTASCLFSPNSKDQILYNLSETNDCTTEMIGITCLSSYSQYLFHVRYPCSLCGTLGCNSDSWTYNMGSSQCSRNACKLSASLEVYYHNIWIV